jgi:hypothetical protein
MCSNGPKPSFFAQHKKKISQQTVQIEIGIASTSWKFLVPLEVRSYNCPSPKALPSQWKGTTDVHSGQCKHGPNPSAHRVLYVIR